MRLFQFLGDSNNGGLVAVIWYPLVFLNFGHEGEKNLCGNSLVCFEKLCVEVIRSRDFIVFQGLDSVDYFFLGGGDVSISRSSTATGMSGSVSGDLISH